MSNVSRKVTLIWPYQLPFSFGLQLKDKKFSVLEQIHCF